MVPPSRPRGNALSRELAELSASNPHDGRSIHIAAGLVVRCHCGSNHKTDIVQCTTCGVHQHQACYYPHSPPLSAAHQRRHLCTPCRTATAAPAADPNLAKRKADEDLGSTTPKRIKQSNSPQTDLPADPKDPRPAGKPVPFPEKVASHIINLLV